MLGYTAGGSHMVSFSLLIGKAVDKKLCMLASGVQGDGSVPTPDSTRCANCSYLALQKFYLLTSFVGIGSTGLYGVINEDRY